MTGLPAFPLAPPRRLAGLTRAIGVPLVLGLLLSAGAGSVVRVKRGDTLSAIARRYHTTVAALRELNQIPGSNVIYAGQSLRVPSAALDTAVAPSRTTARYHPVVAGDTLIGIAARYGTSVSWLQARNRLPRSRIIVIGARLIVGYQAPAAARSRAVLTASVPDPVPRLRVKALIRAEARRAGVDPHLALALAWQESGFQQDIVSSAGAVGVMQVLPETGRWMGTNVVGRRLDLADVEDNVVAGVRFLALLLRMTGKPQAALAGYYQGLASVQDNGQYAETKAYVRNILYLQRRFRRG